MIASTSPWRRVVHGTSLIGLSIWTAGCLSAPPPDVSYDRTTTAAEVYRVFCRRVARAANPQDVEGDRFYEVCDSGAPEDEKDKSLRNMLRYREEILSSLKRAFAEGQDNADVSTFEDGELSGFLRALVPLYDKPQETIPTVTRGIADLLAALIDENDPRAVKVIDTVARLVQRTGYRSPEMNIGAIRAVLTYPYLEDLASKLLPVLSTALKADGTKEAGPARDAFIAVLNALAIELADDPVAVPNRDDSTLFHVLELALSEDPTQASGNVGTTLVLKRDAKGDAIGDSSAGTPFPVAGREDNASERNGDGLAMSGGQPAYQAIDASKTMLAALMRETSVLIGRGDKERSPLESFAHGLKPLLGPWGDRELTIGKNNYSFQGPDITKSALMQLAHAGTMLARYPETLPLIRTLDQILLNNESESTAIDYAALRINEFAKDYDAAKLNGPHEWWDDLMAAAIRMNKRPGLFDALIRSFLDPKSGAQGKLFATWMRYNDQVSYPGAPSTNVDDINKPVDVTFKSRVDRDAPDTGFNRSIWQRTMSLIAALNGKKVCNKTGGFLKATTGIGDLYFPAFNGEGYKECELVEIPDALEIYTQAVVGKAKIAIKDSFADLLAQFGSVTGISGSVGQIQETESQIKGFTTEPTPRALARFLFAPRNEWVTNLFDPQKTNDGVNIIDYEPNGLFPLEVFDEKTPFNGSPSSFIELGVPLMDAFETKELRAATDPAAGGKPALVDGYMFGNLLSVFHKHWPNRKSEPCPEVFDDSNRGCNQSLDRNGKFYSPQTGLVSYEEILAHALDDQDLVNILHKAVLVLGNIKVAGADGAEIDGITALANFLQRMVTVDPTIKKWTGETSTKTNLCVEDGMGGCRDGVGAVIPQLAPIHVLADALKAMDDAFAAEPNDERIDAWHQGRSDLIDQLLETERTGSEGSYKYQLRDRTAYNIVHPALKWLGDRIEAHVKAGDQEAWAVGTADSPGLSDRLAKVLRHPITAGVVDLLDAFWPEKEASGEFTKVVAYMTDERNETTYRALLTAIADSMILLDRDPDLSPAIQFAGLVMSPNVFQAIEGNGAPNAEKSTAYAALELTGGVVTTLNDPKQNEFKKEGEPTALTKLLNNAVLATGDERSALEVLLDAVADVNRIDETADTLTPLTAEEDRKVFGDVKLFLKDDKSDQRSMERLYQVIQSRKVKK
jgi:hypothetical protein